MKHLKKVFNILVVVVAYAYLGYRLYRFDDYAALGQHFSNANLTQYIFLIAALLLFPLNIFFESWKWQYLLRHIEPMSMKEAQRQTYFGCVGAFLTPGRLGDYPTRATLLKDKKNAIAAISLGIIGTYALSSLQVVLGIPAAVATYGGLDLPWYAYLVGVIFVATLCLAPAICRRLQKDSDTVWQRAVRALASCRVRDLMVITAQSALRYAVYCLQMYLVLVFCGIDLGVEQMILAILTYYLFITVTPSVPVADAAVRGSWAIVVFSLFGQNEAAVALSAVLIWIINTVFPVVVGTVLRKDS